MAFHVPGSCSALDEFQTPDGTWYSIYRAVSFDSWLLWKDALPPEPSQRRRLDAPAFAAISELGRCIHEHHQRLTEYRRLGASPFRVGRWWDPDGEPPWCSGRRILLRHEQLSAEAFLEPCAPDWPLEVTLISPYWLELELPRTAIGAADAPATGSSGPPGCRCPGP